MTEDPPLRYPETGNVHLDFHGAVNTTIDFIVANYGLDVLHEIFEKVGREVYADIRAHLMAGDAEELVRHWRYYFEREGAEFDIVMDDDEIVLTVRKCPAYLHVKKIAPEISPWFCDQTIKTNEAMADGSPFDVTTEITGPGSCRQIIRKRSP